MPQNRRRFRALPFSTLRSAALAAGAALMLPAAIAHAGPTAVAKGRVAFKRAETGPKPPLAVNWKFSSLPFQYNPASPIIVDGTLYYAAGYRLHAIDPVTGREKWRYPTDTLLSTPILATPTVSGGSIYFSAGDGLYALNVETGKQKWPAYSVKAGVVTTPRALNGNLYFGGGDHKLYALNAETGDPAGAPWSKGRESGIDAGGDFAGDLVVVGENIYYVTSDQALRAVSTTTGTSRWAQRVNAQSRNMTPIVSGEYIYVAAGDTVFSFRTQNGSPKGTVRVGSETSAPPAVDSDGSVFAINADRYIVALDNRGRGLWKGAPRLDHEVMAAPLIDGDVLYIGEAAGGILALDKSTGRLLWNYIIQPSSARADSVPTVANIGAQPLVSGGSLFVLTDDGAITCFRSDAADGLAPVVTPIAPEQGDYLSGRPPFYVAAKVIDEGSGLDYSSIQLKLDDRLIPLRPKSDTGAEKPGYEIDAETGYIEYTIFDEGGKTGTLVDGRHLVTLTVKDWMGNTITKSWPFSIDDTLKKRSKRPGSETEGGASTSGNTGRGPGRGPGGPGGPSGGGKGGGGGAGGAGGAGND